MSQQYAHLDQALKSAALLPHVTNQSFKQAEVLAHIGGASGSGKTTLMRRLAVDNPGLVTKDLDEFDEQAERELGYSDTPKSKYSDDMLGDLARQRQHLMDAWLAEQGDAPVVLGGHHTEGPHTLKIPTATRLRLDIGPLRSAWRAYRRSQGEALQHRRTLTELPSDYAEARQVIGQLRGMGYQARTPEQIAAFVRQHFSEKQAALLPHVTPREHQLEGARRAKKTDGLLMLYGTGSGKTLGSIAAADQEEAPVSVLVPAALRDNYRKDLDKFVDSGARYDIRSYSSTAEVEPRPVAVMDEVQRMRGQGATYRTALDAAKKAKKRILLSATPIVNAPSDLASTINLLHGRQLYSPEEFTKEFVGTKVKGPFLGLFGKARVEPEVLNRKKLESLLEGRVHHVADVTDTKPTTSETEIPVEMSPVQDRLHRHMQKALPFWAQWAVKHNLPPTKRQAAQLNAFLSGMRQIAASPYGFDKRMTPIKAFENSPKLRTSFERMQKELTNPHGKVMLYSNFPQAAFTPYRAALEQAGVPYVQFDGSLNDAQRKAAIDAFNNGKARVVLVGPAGAEGLSLRGVSAVQMLDPGWNEARSTQAKARAVRLDSHLHLPVDQRHVNIERYVSQPRRSLFKRLVGGRPPVGADEYLASRAREKQKTLEVFLDVLRKAGR